MATVELQFGDLGRPFLIVEFTWLPEICKRRSKTGWVEISRADALITDGIAFFRLMRNRRRTNDGRFGIFRFWPIFRPLAALRTEVDELEVLASWLIELLSHDMAREINARPC